MSLISCFQLHCRQSPSYVTGMGLVKYGECSIEGWGLHGIDVAQERVAQRDIVFVDCPVIDALHHSSAGNPDLSLKLKRLADYAEVKRVDGISDAADQKRRSKTAATCKKIIQKFSLDFKLNNGGGVARDEPGRHAFPIVHRGTGNLGVNGIDDGGGKHGSGIASVKQGLGFTRWNAWCCGLEWN